MGKHYGQHQNGVYYKFSRMRENGGLLKSALGQKVYRAGLFPCVSIAADQGWRIRAAPVRCPTPLARALRPFVPPL